MPRKKGKIGPENVLLTLLRKEHPVLEMMSNSILKLPDLLMMCTV